MTAVVRGNCAIGIPYAARVDHGARRYTFCMINPVPGERAVPDRRQVVALAVACRLSG